MVFVAYPDPVNRDLLYEEMRAVFDEVAQCTVGDIEGIRVDDVGATLPAVQAVVTAHDDTALTEDQQIAQAAAIAILQGKDYLRKQYLNSSPNLSTIYTTLSSVVSGNTYLQQIMDNQIAVYQLETGHDLSSITTNADRARYVECVRRVIALLT